MKVVVLGLGQIGLPTAVYVKQSGVQVAGYDISEGAVERARAEGLEATSRWDDLLSPEVDVYIVCVSTVMKSDKPDLTAIYDVSEKISQSAEAGALISVESTVPAGTCRKIYHETLRRQHVVHVPHRFWAGDPVRYGVRQMRVIGGVDRDSLEHGLRLYREALNIPLHIASSVEVAEMSKIAENASRYVQIAFAQELRQICEACNLDFEEVREACNTKWNIDILEARGGIGGHCLPKDIRYLAAIIDNHRLLDGAISSNSAYIEWLKKR